MFNRDARQRQIAAGIGAIRQEDIAVLEQTHWPGILLPLKDPLPFLSVTAAEEANPGLGIDGAGLCHGGKENRVAYAAAADRGTGQASEFS